MCADCRQSVCSPRCPNAPEPKVVHTCINCGENIVEGDSYYNIDGEAWCESCISDCLTDAEL